MATATSCGHTFGWLGHSHYTSGTVPVEILSIRLGDPPAVAGGWASTGGFAGTAFRPVSEGGDLTVHQVGKRHGVGHRFKDFFWSQLLAFGKGLVHGVDEYGFDFRAGELLAGTGDDDGIVIGGPASVLFDEDVPDLRPSKCNCFLRPLLPNEMAFYSAARRRLLSRLLS